MTFEQLIEQQRPHIERNIQDLARKHHLAAAEIEEFRRVVDRALERNDYELLRAFEGRSTWETYLDTVVTREFHKFQLAVWGQWRPSPEAMRLGPTAMLLEELVVRDRFSIPDAADWMRTTHRVDVPRHRIFDMAAALHLSGADAPAHGARAAESRDPRVLSALQDAMALLSPEDRLILEFRFRDRQSLTRVAGIMKIDVRPLQRKIETATSVIRQSLVTQGVAADEVEALLASPDVAPATPQQESWNLVTWRPSNQE